ncbi:hypothetical protein M405DRAFT_804927 [Rhizopogon salebrosus TDB-379]|nr:hypothetical protein M405DRAFT_804927 [Rhizopogon salebrosus TDB-379]
MFVRISTVSVILLLLSQATVMASSSNSTECREGGTARCCEEDSSTTGGVDCDKCQSYSESCESSYVTSCCYTTITDYYFCNKTG